ncbi:MAG: hypothetical protein QM527_13245 [Alphaproteobacteria bacterium]|nr:hypothetical protein [Alphaproteobacteria bacterium]
MENIIVVLDDATHALNQVLPMRKEGVKTHWILLACPPRLTRHISRWVNQGSRNAWRKRWAQDLLAQVQPGLTQAGDTCELRVLTGNLVEMTEALQKEFALARVLDARRPKVGHNLEPATANQPVNLAGAWAVPGGTAALGAMIILATE